MPGTPPPPADGGPVSQTVVLPLPMSLLFSIQISGRPSLMSACNAVAGDWPLRPFAPSTTMTNWPVLVLKTRRPNASTAGVGVGVVMQPGSQQNTQAFELVSTAKYVTRGP
jgi:hypothetical protein